VNGHCFAHSVNIAHVKSSETQPGIFFVIQIHIEASICIMEAESNRGSTGEFPNNNTAIDFIRAIMDNCV
jgi:hypothetical protein